MRRRPELRILPFKVNLEGYFLQRGKLCFWQLLVLDHLGQHNVAPLQCTLGVEHRVVIAGALEHSNQCGTLQSVERIGRFVEVRAGCHFNAVGVVQKGHRVEVRLKDLILRVQNLYLQRGDGFLELAVQRRCAANVFGVQISRQLLRDGRAPLLVARQRVKHGRQGAIEVDTVMFIKTVVFCGDQSVNDTGRNICQLDPVAISPREHGKLLAISGHHHGGLGRLGLAQV